MAKRVILTLMPGSFEQGFPVILRIKSDGAPTETGIQVVGQLPPAPNIREDFQQWQSAYRQIVMPSSRIKPKAGQVTNFSCHQLGSQLAERLNDWLNSGFSSWQKIRDRLQQNLSETEEIQVVIETDDLKLRQLPWNLWDLFSEYYTRAEIALSTSEYQPLVGTTATLTNKVRILAILGNSTGIDVQQDRAILEQLPHAEITFLVEPQRQSLSDQLWEQQWDILFFAGHSSSQVDGNTGQIYINQTDSLSLTELKNALIRAIERGMQLAIFNSCDGLGLARELAPTHIPQIVVMREPVPDKVAQEFLKYFLQAFASGKSLYLAVREARQRLQGLEDEFPCASCLPVICQNPAVVPLAWPKLPEAAKTPTLPLWRRWRTVFVTSLVITSVLMGVRSLGVLQTWELESYDHLLRQRPSEPADSRILIVGADEEDIRQYKYPLPDAILAQLIEKLEQHRPFAIGLDIFRDQPVPPGHESLVAQLQQNQRLVTVCTVGTSQRNAVAPPPKSPAAQLGFNDLENDQQDDTVRRHLLSRTANAISPLSPCKTPYSFSLQLAYRYLEAKGIPAKTTTKKNWQFGSVVFKRLEARSGGYQNLDARGNQMLLNYRATPQIAQRVTIKDVLTGKMESEWVRNRVVLIGVTAASIQDYHDTPYGRMRGLEVHAHMVSQLLSAVMDGRPLIWWLPKWGDVLWVWVWSLMGGILVYGASSRSLGKAQLPLRLVLALSTSVAILYGLCWVFLLQGVWLPLVSAASALMLTGGATAIIPFPNRQQQ